MWMKNPRWLPCDNIGTMWDYFNYHLLLWNYIEQKCLNNYTEDLAEIFIVTVQSLWFSLWPEIQENALKCCLTQTVIITLSLTLNDKPINNWKKMYNKYGVFNLCQHFEISYSRYANKHYITEIRCSTCE